MCYHTSCFIGYIIYMQKKLHIDKTVNVECVYCSTAYPLSRELYVKLMGENDTQLIEATQESDEMVNLRCKKQHEIPRTALQLMVNHFRAKDTLYMVKKDIFLGYKDYALRCPLCVV